MAEKLSFEFDGYKLNPIGSTSTIDRVEQDTAHSGILKVTSLELYGSGDLSLGRLFKGRKFDLGMVAFLDCLRQLGDYAESQDSNLQLPYRYEGSVHVFLTDLCRINKDKIGEACIRMAFNQDDAWTRALKFCLTNCKWLLAVASNAKPGVQ